MGKQGACATLLLCLVGVAHAYTTFTTHCSSPTSETNFVSSPDTRGTLDILWSCLFTIFTCTWTIQRVNVPEQRNGRDPGMVGDVKWAFKGVWKTTKWMMITVLAPEIILGKALEDLAEAKDDARNMQKFAKQDGVEWSLSHSFFANMEGFMAKEFAFPGTFFEEDRASHEVQQQLLPSVSGPAQGEGRWVSQEGGPNQEIIPLDPVQDKPQHFKMFSS